MTPLSREERDAIIRAHPSAAPGAIEADLDEYEALVAARFAVDPSIPVIRTLGAAPGPEDRAQARLEELHRKLFGEP